MGFEFRIIDPTSGAADKFLPEPMKWEVSPVFSDIGAGTLRYARNSVNAGMLDEDVELALFLDGTELYDCRFIIEDVSGNEVGDALKGEPYTYVGRTMPQLLEDAIVYPINWPTVDGTPTNPGNHHFTNATPGTIMSTLISRAHTRGTITTITIGTFSAATDSAGAAWAKQLTITYDAGVNLLTVLANLVRQGVVEYRMVGRDLRLYNPGTLGTDTTTGPSPIVLRRGREIKEAPFSKTSRPLTNAQLIAGTDGVYEEVTDAASIATRRRRETYQSQGGINDRGSLRAIAQVEIDKNKQARLEKTHALAYSTGSLMPIRDFALGDWVFSDSAGDGSVSKYRVRQAVIKKSQDGSISSSVVLNDILDERDVILARKVEGILGGSAIGGASTAEPAGPDTTIPAAPTGVAISSASYTDAAGQPSAQITVSWTAVTQNTDSTAITDLAGYEVQWFYTGGPSQATAHVDSVQASAQFSPVRLNVGVQARVRAYDSNGHYSAWSSTASGTTAIDVTPPNAPSTPTVTTEFAASLRVTWDGKDNVGANMPGDWDRTEVHVSTVSGFAPDSTTRRDTFTSPYGGVTTIILPAGTTTYYVRLVAYDRTGNVSAASAQGSGVPRKAVDGELESLSVTKLTAGILGADIVVGARIKTADTGARVELNSAGVKVYNSSGTLIVDLNASGTAIFKGTIEAAYIRTQPTSTTPRMEITPQSVTGASIVSLDFYGPNTSTVVWSGYPGLSALIRGIDADWGSSLVPAGNHHATEIQIVAAGGDYTTFSGPYGQLAVYPYGRVYMEVQATTNGRLATFDLRIDSTASRITGQRFVISPYQTYQTGISSETGILTLQDNSLSRELGLDSTRIQARDTLNTLAIGLYLNPDGGNIDLNGGSVVVGTQSGGGKGIWNTTAGTALQWNFTSAELLARNSAMTAYIPIRASSFPVGSMAEYKRSVRKIKRGWALEQVKAAPASIWKYKKAEAQEPANLDHIGPMFDDLPDVVRHGDDAVDVRDLVGLLWAAVSDLADDVKELSKV